MKTLLITFCLLLGIQAQAGGTSNLVRYEIGLKTNDVVNIVVKEKNDKLILVAEAAKLVGGHWSTNKDSVYLTKSLTLSPTLTNEILENLEALRTAKIETQKYQIICMMMPSGYLTYDHLYIDDSTSWRLIDSPKGCWNYTSTHPVEQYAKDQAAELETLLKTLAVQLLKL